MVVIPDRSIADRRSSLQGEHLAGNRSSLHLNAVLVPKAFARHSSAPSVVPPVEGSYVVNSCMKPDAHSIWSEMQRGWSSRYAEPAIRPSVHEIRMLFFLFERQIKG